MEDAQASSTFTFSVFSTAYCCLRRLLRRLAPSKDLHDRVFISVVHNQKRRAGSCSLMGIDRSHNAKFPLHDVDCQLHDVGCQHYASNFERQNKSQDRHEAIDLVIEMPLHFVTSTYTPYLVEVFALWHAMDGGICLME